MWWAAVSLLLLQGVECTYYGKLIGDIKTNAHGLKGKVYAATESTFYLVGLHYDGKGPEAFFWASPSTELLPSGTIVPDEKGHSNVLRAYSGETFTITLPAGKKITDFKSLGVFCRKFAADFGHVVIPDNFQLPKEQVLTGFTNGAHGVRSGPIVLKDSRTVFIPSLHYDGAGPDAYFLIGSSPKVQASGATKVPDENGSLEKLKAYNGKDVTLKVPDNMTWADVKWLSMYCILASQDFAHVNIPVDLHVPVDLSGISPHGGKAGAAHIASSIALIALSVGLIFSR
ncbi:protein Skeletor, isoforms B/C-like [Ornithodoros turicata]